MKKYSWIFALIMALTMAFVFTACPGDDPEDETKKEEEKPGGGGGEFINFGTGAGQTQIVYNRNNGSDEGNVGSVAYVANGYKYTYAAATVGNSNYENAIARFKITLPADVYLNKYGKVSFTWQASGRALGTDPQKGPTADDPGPYASDVNKSKKLYLLATDDADAITPYLSDNGTKAVVVSSSSFDEDLTVAFWNANGASVNGITAQNIELPIIYEKGWLRNDVWIAIYAHVNDPEASFTITNFKLVERATAGEEDIADGGVNVTGEGVGLAEYEPPAKEGAKPFDFTIKEAQLDNWKGKGHVLNGNSATVPSVTYAPEDTEKENPIVDDGYGYDPGTKKLKVKFTLGEQRINIALTPEQTEALKGRSGNDVSFDIVATVTGTDSWRYCIGSRTAGSSWNASDMTIAALELNKDTKFNSNADKDDDGNTDRLGYFILQWRGSAPADATIEIESIRIYTTPFKVTFADGDLKARQGDVELVDNNGFTFKNVGDNYERAWVYFKVTFPTDKKLSDYSKFECKFTLINTQYKPFFVAAFADEAAIDAIPSDGSDASKLPTASVIASNSGNAATDQGKESLVSLPITVGEVDGNEVWIVIRSGVATNDQFKVTDIKFY